MNDIQTATNLGDKEDNDTLVFGEVPNFYFGALYSQHQCKREV